VVTSRSSDRQPGHITQPLHAKTFSRNQVNRQALFGV
jgi:hypothetical protein